MSYTQLLCRTCVLALLLLLADCLCGAFYNALEGKMNKEAEDANAWLGNVLFQIRELKTDAVILGSCESKYVFKPDVVENVLHLPTYNCGSYGTGFLYSNALLNGILNRYSPKVVIWGMNLNFLENEYSKDSQKLRVVYNEVEDAKKAVDYLGGKYEPFLMLSNLYRYNSVLHEYLHCVFTPGKNRNKGYARNCMELHCLPKLIENDVVHNEPLFAELLDATLLRCRNQGVEVKFLMIPTYYAEDFRNSDAYKEFRAIINKHHCELVDEYFHSDDFMKSENFIDNRHLTPAANELLLKRYMEEYARCWQL